MNKRFYTYWLMILMLFLSGVTYGQYFGRNKPSYKEFNFQLYKTPHFELYHYFNDKQKVHALARQMEKWYFYHQQVLVDTFHTRNPIIIYSNHADFQQTTAISGNIDVGTGGVTEGLKRRIVMPVAFSQQQTDHVLGHELVHAFQYHILTESDELSLMAVNNIPLWMIEGMAEFLSIGSMDSQTTLWMRDALIHNRFPTLHQMTRSYRYSPYRYGHAFWAYIAHEYGEQYIPRLFKATALEGYEKAIGDVLMVSTDSLSVAWKEALTRQLLVSAVDSTFSIVGRRLISKENGGRYNISPSISPDGRYLIFLSERDVYALDLFLADAQSGKILRKVYTSTRHDEIDALNFLETAGTWSPDSRHFAYVAFVKGKSVLVLFDAKHRRIADEIEIKGVDGVSYPAWSPDGKEIVFSGLREGVSDLYAYHLANGTITNLTLNNYSCLQPIWSVEGDSLFYVTDQPFKGQKQTSFPFYNLASIRHDASRVHVLKTFDGAQNLNPVLSADGKKVLFLSNRDGRRNLYALSLTDSAIHQLTRYPTGITGMTDLSPALTIAGDVVCYSMLWDGKFTIFRTSLNDLEEGKELVTTRSADLSLSRLFPYSTLPSQVETNLYFHREPFALQVDSFYSDQIKSKFKLDYIGNISAGVATGRLGTGLAGSIEAMFSDILGHHMLYTGLSINGEIYDFGGQVAYINQKRRIKYGVSLSHIPYRTGSYAFLNDTLPNGVVEKKLEYTFRRTFEEKLGVFTFFPLNKTHRIELGAAYAYYTYRIEKITGLNSFSQIYAGNKEKLPSPPGFGVGILDAAYVIDNAKMGLASPVEGKRLRVQVEHYLQGLNMQTLLVDYRKYFFLRPYSLAFRLYHYGRYGKGSDSDRLTSLFLGYPWFVRGYELGDFYGEETEDGKTISMNQLVGSRMIVTNMEWRIPFTGPKEIAWVGSKMLFSELALFFDAGISWDKHSTPQFSLTTRDMNKRIPVFSAGLAYRVNLFGAMVIEPFYAFPIHQKVIKKGEFGINIFAGW
ncbi:hypothetical protein DMA11_19625 [Marinilabiliaceae bacterium JC017]|nr:hypothetical protein DMA11_19625 [Marinilabiliaceae bacterium JC017]